MEPTPEQNLKPNMKPEEKKENTPQTPKPEGTEKEKKEKSSTGLVIALVVLVVIALITVSIAGYFYYTWQNAKKEAEQETQEQEKMIDDNQEDADEDDVEEEEGEEEVDPTTDTDKDGLTDLKEKQLGTDPEKKDTDGDGYDDKEEIDGGFDPLTPAKTDSTTKSNLIQPTDLEYKGAFRLPAGQGSDEEAESWGWGGSSMTFYPEGDPNGPKDGYTGSIFGTGHDQYQYVAEISIPKPVISKDKNLVELNTAENLQEFQDIRGKYPEIPRVGLEYLAKQGKQTSDKLYYAWGQHLEESDTSPSHAWSELDLSNPELAGPWKIDNQDKYVTADYIFSVPKTWADKNVKGKMLVTGRFRDGGQGAQGPSLFAYAPWKDGNPPENGTTLEATTLLKYKSVYEDEEEKDALKNYHHSDEWSGGTWLTSGSKSAVAIVGTKGIGEDWYGFSDGTEFPTDGSEFTGTLPDAPHDARGWWSTSFEAQIIFYNPDDLAAVASGKKKSYEPQPYATLNIDDYLYNIDKINHPDFPVERNQYRLGGASFDSENGILYIFEYRGDSENERPLVHVFEVG